MVSQSQISSSLSSFLEWFMFSQGYEKGEGQIFFDRLLQGFGNAGVLEAGAKCETRIKKDKGTTAFADLVWKPRVIIELKKRGENLAKYYDQALNYWLNLVPNRPQYMVLCNFDEFWIYDLNIQMHDPVHVVQTKNLLHDWHALAFLLPEPQIPIFNNNHIEVTEKTACVLGEFYKSLIMRNVPQTLAQRLTLQIVVALFSEDRNLIPKNTVLSILQDATHSTITQKELFALFTAMATKQSNKKAKRYQHIAYFNGGIFNTVDTVELSYEEIINLYDASKSDWAKVRPSIFGSVFEASTDRDSQHAQGLHYTYEIDIHKIVSPTIIKPFKQKIESAQQSTSQKLLRELLEEIRAFKVLDPACGSGNFLYVAFMELRRLEFEVITLLNEDPKLKVTPSNFFGIDTNSFALELAKVALSLGKKVSADELGVEDNIVPFDNLENNFINQDALFLEKWPECNAIIGNPPFQSKNKMSVEFGVEYRNKLREKFPTISGRADYCVYWFYLSHQHLKIDQRAGLVGTNTIKQNYSRESGLDYIVNNNGTITNAVSSQVWPSKAAVHVSIVNWKKGIETGKKQLFIQRGDHVTSPWEIFELDNIPSSLTEKIDVTLAQPIKKNTQPKRCFQGQTHGHEGFLLSKQDALSLIHKNHINQNVLFPFLNGEDFIGKTRGNIISRYIIDFHPYNIIESQRYKDCFKLITRVLKDKEKSALAEQKRNAELRKSSPNARINNHHANDFQTWWHPIWPRRELIQEIRQRPRYIVCAAVTKKPIFEFVSNQINPTHALMCFMFDDDYSFGILQSIFHWEWFKARCSTLESRHRYTSQSVFDTFPWPQYPTERQVKAVANAAVNLRQLRHSLMEENNLSLRELYRTLDQRGSNPLRDAHETLDIAVSKAYGTKLDNDILNFLLTLNLELTNNTNKKTTMALGLPNTIIDPSQYVTADCISVDD